VLVQQRGHQERFAAPRAWYMECMHHILGVCILQGVQRIGSMAQELQLTAVQQLVIARCRRTIDPHSTAAPCHQHWMHVPSYAGGRHGWAQGAQAYDAAVVAAAAACAGLLLLMPWLEQHTLQDVTDRLTIGC
jgi:hypothetical protein